MYVAIVDDAPAGPPSVMIQTMSKSWIEPMTARKAQIRIVGPSSGSVTKRKRLPARCAVHRGRLVQLARHALEAGEEEDDREADVLPRDHDEERVEDEPEVGEPELDEPAEPDALERRVDEAVGLEDLEEDDGGDRLREHVRREEDQPQEAAAAQRPVEQQRDAERERQLQQDRERDEDRVVLHRLPEGRVAECLAVVVEPDEVGQRAEPVPGVDAVVDRLDDRDDRGRRRRGEGGREEERDLEPPSA